MLSQRLHRYRNTLRKRRSKAHRQRKDRLPAFEVLEERKLLTTATIVDVTEVTGVADGSDPGSSYQTISNLSTTFTSDGSPVRLQSSVNIRGIGASHSALQFRFAVDGVPVSTVMSRFFEGGDENAHIPMNFEDFITGLAPGSHDVSLQAREHPGTTGGDYYFGWEEDPTLRIYQYSAIPSADFDEDFDVDGFDFLAWQLGLGTLAPNATKSDGDADNDQDVDGDDLTVWDSQYGTTPPPLAAALVAEQAAAPSSALLAGEPTAIETVQGQPLATTVSGAAFSTNTWLALPSVGIDMRPLAIVEDASPPNQLSAEQIDRAFERLPSETSLAVSSVESLLVERADDFNGDPQAVDEAFDEVFASVF